MELYNVNVPLGFVAGNGNGEWVREHTFVDTLAGYSGLFGRRATQLTLTRCLCTMLKLVRVRHSESGVTVRVS